MIEHGRMKKNKKEVYGLEQLRKRKEETIEKWSKLGLLEGLDGNIKNTVWKLFKSQLSYVINETGNTVSEFDNIKFPVVRLNDKKGLVWNEK